MRYYTLHPEVLTFLIKPTMKSFDHVKNVCVVTDYRPVFNEFYKGGRNIKTILILRPKLGV